MDKAKIEAFESMEFDIFSSDMPWAKPKEATGSLKTLLNSLPASKSKFYDTWRRIRMKLKFKSTITAILKELRFFAGNSDVVFKKEDIIKKLLNHKGNTENLVNIDQLRDYMIHPDNIFKSIWNGYISILLVYTAIVMPVSMAFYESDNEDGWYYIDLILDGSFFLDILITFNSAFYDNFGVLVSRRRQVTLKYLKSWFAIDLVSCIPFNLISGSKKGYNSLLRLARLPRLAKLLRLSRLVKMLKNTNGSNGFLRKIEDVLDIKTSETRLFQGFMTVLVMLHLMACLWYYEAKFQEFPIDCWVMKFGYIDFDVGSLYLRSLYFIITTLATVGYGDIYPVSNIERLIIIVWIIIVMFFMTFNISSMSNMISGIDTQDSILQYKISVIEEFCKESKLNKELKIRLKESIKYSTEKNGGSLYNKQDLILELPKHLRYEVAMAMHKGNAREIFFLKYQDKVFVSNIIPLLISQRFRAGDVVYVEGEHPDEMYFIVKGRIGFAFSEKKIIFKQKFQGMHFGDIEILLFSPRLFHTKAMVDTEVLALKKNTLNGVLQRFPLIQIEMKIEAEKQKDLCLKSIYELKAIFQLKRKGEIRNMTEGHLRSELKGMFIEHQKNWNVEKDSDLTPADLLLASETLKGKVSKLWELQKDLNDSALKLSEKFT